MPKGQNIPHKTRPQDIAGHPDTDAENRIESRDERHGVTPEMRAHAERSASEHPKAAPSSERHEMEQAFLKQKASKR